MSSSNNIELRAFVQEEHFSGMRKTEQRQYLKKELEHFFQVLRMRSQVSGEAHARTSYLLGLLES